VGASEETIKATVQNFESDLWTHRIQAALTAGDSRTAKELMGKATGSITTADREKLLPRLQAQLKVTEAIAGVDEIFGKLVSPNTNAPFPAMAVDAELRKKFADNPEVLIAARSEAAHRRQAIEIQQRESNHASVAAVMQMMHEQGKPLAQIMKTPEYQAMDGDQKAKLILHDESIRATRASRAHAEAGRAAALESRAASQEQRAMLAMERRGEQIIATYMLNPETVKSMSDDAMRAIALDVGPRNALALRNYRDNLDKMPGGVATARMDVQSFKTIIADFGYKPELMGTTRKLTSETDKAQRDEMGAIFLEVNQRIQAKAQEKKRPLELAEKEQIMRDALSQKVKLDYNWYQVTKTDREVPLIALPREGEAATERRNQLLKQGDLLPITSLSARDLSSVASFIRSVRPDTRSLTDDAIAKRFQLEIERAAALKSRGATAADVRAIFTGEQ
jgi:hypothetical protein